MKRLVPFLAFGMIALFLAACATAPANPKPRAINYSLSDAFKADLKIGQIIALSDGSDVEFNIEIESEMGRQFSFFDPPNGDNVKYIGSVSAGKSTLKFAIAAADLKKMKEVTMRFGFSEEDRNFIFLNTYDIKRAIQ